jgi:hypothetical protein
MIASGLRMGKIKKDYKADFPAIIVSCCNYFAIIEL